MYIVHTCFQIYYYYGRKFINFSAQDVPASVSPVFLILIGVIVLAIVGTVAVVIIIRTHTYQEKRQQKGNVKEKKYEFLLL